MSNPFLPKWEYIPDGEPHVFGDRIYIYGSHDLPASDHFCDCRLKVWSASIHDPSHWICHGNIFRTDADSHAVDSSIPANSLLYAPDVIKKGDKYYLYLYIHKAKGCVAVANQPEGPFSILSHYQYTLPDACCDQGQFIDPGILVDDDGKVYIYCGFTRSYMAQLNPDNMYEILDNTYKENILPPLDASEDAGFFEACSPRKIGDLYYLIYSPKKGSRLAYATSSSPNGPFAYRGYIIDNSDHYPAGNNHGSLCKIKDQWYIFYHRMTNNTLTSRRSCVERIHILPDGSIPLVPMTSLGFEESLNPYDITDAEIACYLTGGCYITELDLFRRIITNITDGCVIGYRYFDFGHDNTSGEMTFHAKIRSCGSQCELNILLDDPVQGIQIGQCHIKHDSVHISCRSKKASGVHAVFFVIKQNISPEQSYFFQGRTLFDLEQFVFVR